MNKPKLLDYLKDISPVEYSRAYNNYVKDLEKYVRYLERKLNEYGLG